MVRHIQTIRRPFSYELFECVWLICGIVNVDVSLIKRSILPKNYFILNVFSKNMNIFVWMSLFFEIKR